ncbi:CLUMA_CG004684, isoform A [Clunio marinus]|uniref:CLUMA_CG004684, isoform A n=1 Tax=Clunio marinus TaxID=568069 RepID=A0A1J1HUF1_9DIPT|nr:CLUMA_CG004684, isoform A [Clunio marinus]
MKFSIGLLLILLFWKEINAETRQAASPKVKLAINKCCRIGDVLNKDLKCDAGIGSNKWAPKVFFPKKQTFYVETGSLPNFMVTQEEVRPLCKNFDLVNSTEVFIVGNGSLYLYDKHISINKIEDYCVDQVLSVVCRRDKESVPDNMALIELTKCCGPNQIYYYNSNATNTPCQTINNSNPLFGRPLIEGVYVDLTYKFPDCTSNEFAIAGPFLSANHYPETGDVRTESGKVFHRNQYCLDHVQSESYEGVKIFTCSEHYAILPSITSQHQDDARFAIYSIGLLISVLFLFATLAVSFLLISNHHVLHWRCQTNYVICLLIGDLLLAITQLAGSNITGASCVVIAHLMHFFFLATFFWLNAMSFNIWWTFRDFRPTSMEKGQELVRLRIYEVYAWGMPIVITVVAAILDNLPESSTERFLRPRFGENKCWFYGDMEIFAYFFGPIGILLCVNVMLFLSTARQLTCGLWKRDDVKSTTERAALGRVCLKLVIVMGVTWIVDVLSWAVGGPHYIWYFSDIVNSLQGLFIFIVVGCQPQVWSALKRLWSSRSSDHRMTGTTNGPQHSISSHGIPSMDASVTNNTTTNSKVVPVETMC